MKNKTVKRIMCMLLCALIALSTPLGVLAVELNSAPVVYVGEISDNALYTNPNKSGSEVVFDMTSTDFTADITNVIAPFGYYTLGLSDLKASGNSLANAIKALMDPMACTESGVSADASVGPWYYSDPISAYRNEPIYTEDIQGFARAAAGYVTEDEIFFFSYDWRLDPADNADKLKAFIDHVEEATGKGKVAVLARGYGGIVVNSYLYEYEEHAAKNITSAVFYNCPILGNSLMGDIMRCRFTRTTDDHENIFESYKEITGEYRGLAIIQFLKDDALGYASGISENVLGANASTALVSFAVNWLFTTILTDNDFHKDIGKGYNTFVSNIDSAVYEVYLKECLRNMPGLWALVPEKDFDYAYDYLFEDVIINSTLAKKIADYREIQENTESTLSAAKNNGINVCVIANYGYQLLPFTVSLDDMSDSVESVKYASAGAVTTDNSTEPDHFENCFNDNHNHMNPDGTIDATYCALPESTWFINNAPHGCMTSEAISTFLVWLIFGFSQRSVRENASYTQYMEYNEYHDTLAADVLPGDDIKTVYGDIDDNGKIDAADARSALRIAVGLDVVNKEVAVIADVDGNGSVEAADAREILRYAVGLITEFRV